MNTILMTAVTVIGTNRVRPAAAVLVLVAAGALGAQNAYQHRGEVLNASDREQQPVFAQVAAYRSATAADPVAPDCPTFQGFLTSTNTNKGNGTFVLSIDASASSYVAVYCADGFVPRVDQSLQNSANEPVIPRPVPLVRRGVGYQEMTRMLEVELTAFVSNVRYFRQANPGAFDDAIGAALGPDASPQERDLIDAVRRLMPVAGN
jgi:hypothetical protein